MVALLEPRCSDEMRNTAIWGVLPDVAESAIARDFVKTAAQP
jgi:hypothetical protein